jgi:hypothetical protein
LLENQNEWSDAVSMSSKPPKRRRGLTPPTSTDDEPLALAISKLALQDRGNLHPLASWTLRAGLAVTACFAFMLPRCVDVRAMKIAFYGCAFFLLVMIGVATALSMRRSQRQMWILVTVLLGCVALMGAILFLRFSHPTPLASLRALTDESHASLVIAGQGDPSGFVQFAMETTRGKLCLKKKHVERDGSWFVSPFDNSYWAHADMFFSVREVFPNNPFVRAYPWTQPVLLPRSTDNRPDETITTIMLREFRPREWMKTLLLLDWDTPEAVGRHDWHDARRPAPSGAAPLPSEASWVDCDATIQEGDGDNRAH